MFIYPPYMHTQTQAFLYAFAPPPTHTQTHTHTKHTQVIAMEAESEAVGLLVAGDGLESKFAALEGGTVEDELAALKQGMLGSSSSPVAALPEGRPLKDAIDVELEELRRKARE